MPILWRVAYRGGMKPAGLYCLAAVES